MRRPGAALCGGITGDAAGRGLVLPPRRDAQGRVPRPRRRRGAARGGEHPGDPCAHAGRDRARCGVGDRRQRRRARPDQSAVQRAGRAVPAAARPTAPRRWNSAASRCIRARRRRIARRGCLADRIAGNDKMQGWRPPWPIRSTSSAPTPVSILKAQPLADALPKVAERLGALLVNPAFVAETFTDDTPPGRRELLPRSGARLLRARARAGGRQDRQAAQPRHVMGDLRQRQEPHRDDRVAPHQSGERGARRAGAGEQISPASRPDPAPTAPA